MNEFISDEEIPDYESWLDKQQQSLEEERKTRELLMCGRCDCPLEWCICPENEL